MSAAPAPGLHQIPAEVYHADPLPVASLSAGIVDILTRESPLHAWNASPKLNPHFQPEVDSKFDIGAAAHSLLFEGVDRMAVFDPNDYPSKQGGIPKGWTNNAIRAARDAAREAGRIPVLLDDAMALKEMVRAALEAWDSNEDLRGYRLANGKNEWSILWNEGATWCRCKPDHLSEDRRLIVDAKFTDLSANPSVFERQIDRMGYDSRAAFYLRGNAATGGAEDARYVYLIQEVKPPYVASFVALDAAYIDLGKRKVERAIATWRACMVSGKWPGYLNRIHYAAPPSYALVQEEETELRGFEYDPATLFAKEKA